MNESLINFSPRSDTALDGVIIRVELDPGFRLYFCFVLLIILHFGAFNTPYFFFCIIRLGRQYGRGMSGGQVRDEKRTNFDPTRGGLGRQAEQVVQIGGNEC